SGGVTVSYFEWVQNNQGYYWREDEVENKLYEVMTKSVDAIYNTAQTRRVDMRLAAYMVGVRKTAEASMYRCWIYCNKQSTCILQGFFNVFSYYFVLLLLITDINNMLFI